MKTKRLPWRSCRDYARVPERARTRMARQILQNKSSWVTIGDAVIVRSEDELGGIVVYDCLLVRMAVIKDPTK